MTLTNCTYVANPRFACPRSYWRGILIGYGSGASVSLIANVIHIHQNFVGGFIDTQITLDPRFYLWSSNNWTLDHIFIDQRSQVNGGPDQFFAAQIDCGLMTPSLLFGAGFTFSGATQNYNVFLQPAPSTYWLPELP